MRNTDGFALSWFSSSSPDSWLKSMNRAPVLVDLALQGRGSHGAFTSGVLDRLLEESWLQIEGISGTTAGAMDAAVLVMAMPKAELTARERVSKVFREARLEAALLSPFRRSPFDILLDDGMMPSGRFDHVAR